MKDLGECWEFSDRVEVGIFLHVLVLGVAVFDRHAEQADGSLRKLTPLRLVLPGKRLRCKGVGAGGIVVQVGSLAVLSRSIRSVKS